MCGDSVEVISIDPELCNDCGICVKVCSYSIICTDPSVKTPFVPEELGAYCSKCGHCEAFCPAGAIESKFETVHLECSGSPGPEVTAKGLGQYLAKRRSVRHYTPEAVDRETIEQIFDIVRYAPTGMNLQPVHWMIIHDKEKVRNITSMTIEWMEKVVSGEIEHPLKQVIPGIIRSYEKGNDPICRGAPHLAIAHASEMMGTAKVDSLIAMSWFDIVAPSFGLGTCWAGFVSIAANEYKPLLDELELPEGHSFQYAIMFGHPAYKVNSIPGRDLAKLTWK